MVTIKIRGGTDAEITTTNPTLAVREIAYNTTKNIFYVGDGTHAMTALVPVGRTLTTNKGWIGNSSGIAEEKTLATIPTWSSGQTLQSTSTEGIFQWVNTITAPSSTDNAISRYDGTSGLIQNSLVTIDDSGSISIPTGQYYKIGTTALSYSDIGAASSSHTHTDFVKKSDYDANTILAATTDDTPIAVTITEQTLLGRITGGVITALSVSQIKTLLGLGGAAVLNVGTTTGTVAAGDDSRFSNTGSQAKVSANDTTASYLGTKLVAGTNITITETNDGGNETLTLSVPQTVVVNASDTLKQYLADKITSGTGIEISVVDNSGVKTIQIGVSPSILSGSSDISLFSFFM